MPQAVVVRSRSPRTQEASLAAVKGVAQYSPQRPATLSEEQLHAYIRALLEQRHWAPSRVRVTVMGLRFFSTQRLQRPLATLPLPKRTKPVPVVLSRDEGAGLLASPASVRERALVRTTYGGGLRGREVVRRRGSDLDGQRDRLRVAQGQGRKDRYPLLGPRLLAALRPYWQG